MIQSFFMGVVSLSLLVLGERAADTVDPVSTRSLTYQESRGIVPHETERLPRLRVSPSGSGAADPVGELPRPLHRRLGHDELLRPRLPERARGVDAELCREPVRARGGIQDA